MAYCQLSSTSDVYMIAHTSGGIVCMVCNLTPLHKQNMSNFAESMDLSPEDYPDLYTPVNVHGSSEFNTRSDALLHLQTHRDAGHAVPEIAFERLRSEIEHEGELIIPSHMNNDELMVDMGDQFDEDDGDG